MSVLILLVIVGLLIWVFVTRERYVDLTIPESTSDSRDREARALEHRIAVHRAEAEFWQQRAVQSTSADTRSVAENLAAFHRRRADELAS